MRKLSEAVGLSLARNRPIDPGLRRIYDMMIQRQPALAELAVADDSVTAGVPIESLLFEPPLRFDGSGWKEYMVEHTVQ